MKKFLPLFFTFSFILFSMMSCKDIENKDNTLDSVYVTLSEFDTVNVYDVFNVYLKQDSVYSLKILTTSDLIDNVEYSQTGNVLNINDLNKFYFLKSYDKSITLYITAPDLKAINLFSASSLYSIDTLKYNRFLVRAYGYSAFADVTVDCDDHFFLSLWKVTGDYTVSGKCTYLQILNHGTSYIHASNLESQYCYIDQNSTGNAELFANKKLKVIIRDIGNVYYKGNPVIELDRRGEGNLLKM